MSRTAVAALVATVVFCGPAHATLTPVGDVFQVATATDAYCISPRAAIDTDGGFHVVWQSFDPANEDSSWDVHGRSFDAGGAPRDDQHAINTYTLGFQEAPVVAIADGGEFVVAWSGAGAGDQYGTFARVHEADGAAKSDEIRLHDATPVVYERGPAAAGAGAGFLVAWIEDTRIAGVRMDANGAAVGTFESPVAEPNHVAVDSLPAGEFVVAWSSSQYSSDGVAYGEIGHVDGRFFGADGTGGDGFQANTERDDPTGYGFVVDGANKLALAADAAGNFVAGYDSYVPSYVYNVDEQVDGYNIGAKMERFLGGQSQAAEFVAATPATAVSTDVAMTPGGNVVVVYEGDAIFARALDCHGADISGGAIQIDGGIALERGNPAVSVNENGDVVVVWEQQRAIGNGSTIVGRRLRLADGCALCGDADANGRVTAVDALAALQASVSLGACVLGRCDTDGSQTVTATDALRILTAAVADGPPSLSCAGTS